MGWGRYTIMNQVGAVVVSCGTTHGALARTPIFGCRAKLRRTNGMQITEFRSGITVSLGPRPEPVMASCRPHFFYAIGRHESTSLFKVRLIFALLILLLWAISGTNAFAQAVYGSIAGTVYDSSGAGVPKAAVTITDLKKSISYTTTTNESGNYTQSHLIIGQYRVRVEFAGFKAAVQENVDVAVDTVTTVDVTLQPGDVTQTINVTAEVPLLKSERTDVSTTLSERAVMELPTINRNFTELILLTPGSIQFNWNDTSTENPQGGIAVNVNGQHFTGLGYLLDGTDNRDFMYGNMLVVPDLDSVVQAIVTSSNFDAEFGQAQAGMVTTSTKSGTNEYHGRAFMFRRNDLTQARDPFSHAPKPLESVRRIDGRPDFQEQNLLLRRLPGNSSQECRFADPPGSDRRGAKRRFERIGGRVGSGYF
ncbi:MAG: hypothetical protein DMG58_08475 [Acidobacteria bacterium]|nr:MAG: hypothetical protein DMG58_08475 [Acidobacteriota bacterium]